MDSVRRATNRAFFAEEEEESAETVSEGFGKLSEFDDVINPNSALRG